MKLVIDIFGTYPVMRGLNEQQFINAIAPRLIDIRNPVTGLQIDLFGRVNTVDLSHFDENQNSKITAEIEIDDSLLQGHQLTLAQLAPVLVSRISKLRHPATGAMSPVSAQLSTTATRKE